MKIHKLENGDIIKILPFVDNNNNITWCKEYDFTFCGNYRIYDDTNKKYLRRILNSEINVKHPKLSCVTRYFFNIYINGEIYIVGVGRTLYKMIYENKEVLNIRSNTHLNIVMETETNGFHHSGYPSWNKSFVDKNHWTPPVADINSKEEWLEYIKSNQPDLDKHIEENSILKHKKILIDYFGSDILSEIIADDRQIKLDKILV